jgi:hypothetical protein
MELVTAKRPKAMVVDLRGGRDNKNLQKGRTRHDKRHQSSDQAGWAADGLAEAQRLAIHRSPDTGTA